MRSSRVPQGRARRPFKRARKAYAVERVPPTIRAGWLQPRTKPIKLKYVTQITLSPSDNTAINREFRANSLYDPEVAVGGHQPYGFDQLSAFYQHYTVIGSKITVTPIDSNDLTQGGIFGVTLASTTGTLTGYETLDIMERPGTQSYVLPLKSVSGWTSKPVMRAHGKFSAKRFFGLTSIVGNPAYRTSVGANPTEDAIFAVWYGSATGGDPTNASFAVEIEYIAIFSEKKELTPS